MCILTSYGSGKTFGTKCMLHEAVEGNSMGPTLLSLMLHVFQFEDLCMSMFGGSTTCCKNTVVS